MPVARWTVPAWRGSIGAAQRTKRFLLGKKTYFLTTGFYFAERIYLLAIGVLLYAVLARAYGPEIMGMFSFAQTLVSFAAPFLAVGAEAIVIRELVRKRDKSDLVMGTAFALITTSTLVVMSVPLVYAFFEPANNPLTLNIAILLSLSFIPNGLLVIEHFFKANMNAASIVLPRTMVLTATTGLKIFVACTGYSILVVAAITFVEALIIGLALVAVYVRRGHSPLRWQVSRTEAWFLFRQTVPAMISAVAVLLFYRINHLLVGRLASFSELGKYSVAFQILQLSGMLPLVLFSTIYPRLVALHGTDSAHFYRIMNWLYFSLALAGYCICAVTYLSADAVIDLALGARYAGAGTVLSILIFSSVFSFLGSVRAQEINIYNLPSYHLVNATIGLAVLVPISLFLIPRFGAVGAAWGVTAGTFVSGVLTSFLLPRTRASGRAQLRALLLLPPLRFNRLHLQPRPE